LIAVTKLKVEHLVQLALHNSEEMRGLTQSDFEALTKCEYQYTIVARDTKEILFCGGIAMYWPGRGEVWGKFNRSRPLGRYLLPLHRTIRQFLDAVPVRRIESSVLVGFTAGHKWTQALGFQLEAPCLRSYSPNGSDCSLYARVK
jgi:hypothetical protein